MLKLNLSIILLIPNFSWNFAKCYFRECSSIFENWKAKTKFHWCFFKLFTTLSLKIYPKRLFRSSRFSLFHIPFTFHKVFFSSFFFTLLRLQYFSTSFSCMSANNIFPYFLYSNSFHLLRYTPSLTVFLLVFFLSNFTLSFKWIFNLRYYWLNQKKDTVITTLLNHFISVNS